jgi:hypothetical protein
LWYLPASLLIYLALHDTWFYWTHRLLHRPAWFRAVHAVHHASRPPTAWAAMSFHPLEALSGAVVIPALVLLVPIHAAVLGLVLAIMTVMGVTNHMGWEMFPQILVRSRLGGWLITASHHQRHHDVYRATTASISARGIACAAPTAGFRRAGPPDPVAVTSSPRPLATQDLVPQGLIHGMASWRGRGKRHNFTVNLLCCTDKPRENT